MNTSPSWKRSAFWLLGLLALLTLGLILLPLGAWWLVSRLICLLHRMVTSFSGAIPATANLIKRLLVGVAAVCLAAALGLGLLQLPHAITQRQKLELRIHQLEADASTVLKTTTALQADLQSCAGVKADHDRLAAELAANASAMLKTTAALQAEIQSSAGIRADRDRLAAELAANASAMLRTNAALQAVLQSLSSIGADRDRLAASLVAAETAKEQALQQAAAAQQAREQAKTEANATKPQAQAGLTWKQTDQQFNDEYTAVQAALVVARTRERVEILNQQLAHLKQLPAARATAGVNHPEVRSRSAVGELLQDQLCWLETQIVMLTQKPTRIVFVRPINRENPKP